MSQETLPEFTVTRPRAWSLTERVTFDMRGTTVDGIVVALPPRGEDAWRKVAAGAHPEAYVVRVEFVGDVLVLEGRAL